MKTTMENQIRFVNIRGYVVECIVLGYDKKEKEYFVSATGKNSVERVPAHMFYHRTLGDQLIPRGPHFDRLYPNHPIEIEQLSFTSIELEQFNIKKLIDTWRRAFMVTCKKKSDIRRRLYELQSWDKCNGHEIERHAKIEALKLLMAQVK